jgi:hypothetical protein
VHYSDFSKALLLHPGVVRIEMLTDDILEEVRGIEYSPLNFGFTQVDPAGLGEVADYDLKLILFCSSRFPMFTESFMDIVDSRGNLVGHDIMEKDKIRYIGDQYVWLTSNLFFDMTLVTEHHLKTVIHSLGLHIDGLPSDVRPRVYYPCAASADHLNEEFGITGKVNATVLVGVNNVEF